jgi:hypothetical protein
VIFLASCFIVNAQSSWELKKNEDGIKVYTKSSDDSRLKSIRVTCDLQGSLSELTALLLDAGAHTSWVYSTKSSHIVKQISPNQQVYYSEINLPWPLTNRDVVVMMTLRQDPETKVLEVSADAVNSDIPPKKGLVRVSQSSVVWKVAASSPESMRVEYIAHADPGGSVPAWISNMFSTKGPLETFRRLKKLMASKAYAPAKYAFIVD